MASPTPNNSISKNDLIELISPLINQQQQGLTNLTPNQQNLSNPPHRRQIGFQVPQMFTEENDTLHSNDLAPWQIEQDRRASTAVQHLLNNGETGTKVIDARYCKSWMKQSYKRSTTSKTEEARFYNKRLYQRLKGELQELGWSIIEKSDTELDIQEK